MKVPEIITQQLINYAEKNGTLPWRKPWSGGGEAPKNLASGKSYRGINVWLLSTSPYSSPYWVSFKQCQARGGKVKKGEKGSMVCFYKSIKGEREGKDGLTHETTFPLLRYYYVFNVEQCEGLEYPKPKENVNIEERIAECERIAKDMPERPDIRHEEQRAFYNPNFDFVNMPKYETFESNKEYYSTLFHELAHSTGHEKRLNRKDFCHNFFGDHDYSREELVAEITAAFICGHVGIENKTIENSGAYVKHWIQQMKGDSKLIIQAASQAQKAMDFILNIKKEVPNGTEGTDGSNE